MKKSTQASPAKQPTTSAKSIKGLIKLVKATDKSKVLLSEFIKDDITNTGGQVICLTAQQLCIKQPSNSFKKCRTLNTLQRAIMRITQDEKNGLDPVKITRTDKKSHTCELLPNGRKEKEFSTFVEIEKLLNRKVGKTANNLTEKETQTLIQALGQIVS